MSATSGIRNTWVRVNSKFRSMADSTTHFSYNLASAPFSASTISVALISATIPRMYTNIDTHNNVLEFEIELFGEPDPFRWIFYCPIGQYNISQMVAQINGVGTLNPSNTKFYRSLTVQDPATSLDNYVFASYDEITHKIYWQLKPGTTYAGLYPSSSTKPLDMSSLAEYIGLFSLRETQQIIYEDNRLDIAFPYDPAPGAPRSYMPNPPQLQGPDVIFIQSRILAQATCYDDPVATGGTIPLIGPIPVASTPYGFSTNWEASELILTTYNANHSSPFAFSNLLIQISDKFGNTLTMPSNCSIDLLFKIAYIPN